STIPPFGCARPAVLPDSHKAYSSGLPVNQANLCGLNWAYTSVILFPATVPLSCLQRQHASGASIIPFFFYCSSLSCKDNLILFFSKNFCCILYAFLIELNLQSEVK